MYRLVPCIPVFRGFFFNKSAKRMCICNYVKNCIGTFQNLCFDVKKGYKQIIVLDHCKTHCSWSNLKLLPHSHHAKNPAQFIKSFFTYNRF